ncbi:hypothetical protein evm_014413 [Chilo suppressalis]|nr:hypothetical protein evm_014413 [Chilo suppressalis]
MSTELCISCRTPIGDRRSYTWTSRESQHIEITQFVIEDLIVRQEEPIEVICRPCWQLAERRYLRHQREVDHICDISWTVGVLFITYYNLFIVEYCEIKCVFCSYTLRN